MNKEPDKQDSGQQVTVNSGDLDSVIVVGEQPAFQQLHTCSRSPYTFKEYARRACWQFIQKTFFRISIPRCYGWQCFWLRLFGAEMAAVSSARSSTKIFYPWLLKVGTHTTLAERVKVYNLGSITIGDHTVISQDVTLCAGTHDYTDPSLPLLRPEIKVGNGVWVCAEAFIGPGVTIGDNAIVGARAVVTRDVPAGMVVAGNPAKVIKPRFPDKKQCETSANKSGASS